MGTIVFKRTLRYGQDFEDKKTKEHCKIMRIDKYVHYRLDGKKTQSALFRDFIKRFIKAQKWKIFTLEIEGRILVFKSKSHAQAIQKLLGIEKRLEPQYKTVYQIKEMILNVQDNNTEEEETI